MKILILSKTRMGDNHVCVGGLDLSNHKFLRLLNRGGDRNPRGWYQYSNTPLNVGDIWEIDYDESPFLEEPHNEDVFIMLRGKIAENIEVEKYIYENKLLVWEGHIENLYNGNLSWGQNGKGYLEQGANNLPEHSVGFWRSDRDLVYSENKYLYKYKKYGIINTVRTLSWVGAVEPLVTLPAGTLLRVSLAKWWKHKDSLPETPLRCYLQLSGWY